MQQSREYAFGEYLSAEYTFTHLGFDKTHSDRVQFKYYESAHMAYLNQASAKQLKADIAHFIESTEHPAPLESPAAQQAALHSDR